LIFNNLNSGVECSLNEEKVKYIKTGVRWSMYFPPKIYHKSEMDRLKSSNAAAITEF